MAALYRKKPVVITALTYEEVAKLGCLGPFQYNGHRITPDKGNYLIATLEGTMCLSCGDMLIVGVNGEIYPCKMDIFEKTYERVEIA